MRDAQHPLASGILFGLGGQVTGVVMQAGKTLKNPIKPQLFEAAPNALVVNTLSFSTKGLPQLSKPSWWLHNLAWPRLPFRAYAFHFEPPGTSVSKPSLFRL